MGRFDDKGNISRESLLSRRTLVIILGALLVLAGVGGFRYADFLLRDTAGADSPGLRAVQDEGSLIAVHVKGAVAEPGLYWLAPDSRVDDAVQAAGGALPEADLDNVNLAAFVSDGSQLYVPFAGESEDAVSGPLNINTATEAQLEALDGIGETKARAIVEYRESHGDFASVEQLTRVDGIGDATLDKIREQICVY
ncbi:MAG: ComEA family DNA-binding protein [Firmicutes bacterium]|nr:ComEA family DNA-binding protein [Bacillota bacterium]MBR0178855.1 ComEA family DNA-binding protein [Bacillota bacterium]